MGVGVLAWRVEVPQMGRADNARLRGIGRMFFRFSSPLARTSFLPNFVPWWPLYVPARRRFYRPRVAVFQVLSIEVAQKERERELQRSPLLHLTLVVLACCARVFLPPRRVPTSF